jgi:hypothetical protein
MKHNLNEYHSNYPTGHNAESQEDKAAGQGMIAIEDTAP